MRILPLAVALLAISGCMSITAKHAESPEGAESQATSVSTPIVEETTQNPPETKAENLAPQAQSPVAAAVEPPAKTEEVASTCGNPSSDIQLPYFLKEKPALVVGLDRICKDKDGEAVSKVSTNLSIVGVSCTGAPGLITRRGHSTQNWEVVKFGMDLSCNMPPPEVIKALGQKQLGIDAETHLISYVPMMIEYWEFDKNNDAGLGPTPTLTGPGGGADQWKKNSTKSTGFPIKLYGHSSTMIRDQSVYEAHVILIPRSNQRQFEVLVQEMKQMSPEELKVTLDRCKSKTNARSGCDEAFLSQ